MPGMRCTVAVCNNSFVKTKNAGLAIAYHQFPKNETLRQIWIERCQRSGDWNPDSCHICSVHFRPDDYKHSFVTSKRRLKPTAVPTLFLTAAPHLPEMKDQRRNHKRIKKTIHEDVRAEFFNACYQHSNRENMYEETESGAHLMYDEHFIESTIKQEVQEESEETKYCEFLEDLQAHDEAKEPYVKEVETQTENDSIIQFLIQRNFQLENKLKQLEMKLTNLENFVQNSQV